MNDATIKRVRFIEEFNGQSPLTTHKASLSDIAVAKVAISNEIDKQLDNCERKSRSATIVRYRAS
jgi:hypothetical protein